MNRRRTASRKTFEVCVWGRGWEGVVVDGSGVGGGGELKQVYNASTQMKKKNTI